MAYNFPNSPAVNDIFGRYKWDGEKWILTVGGRSGAPVIPPAILTGLIWWVDASVTASLTLSGSSIINIADQSGAGNHMGNGSTGGKPTYNATGLNGRPSMHFANNAIYSTSAFPLGTGNTLTVAAVATLATGSTDGGRLISYKGGGTFGDANSPGNFVFVNNTNQAGFYRDGAYADTTVIRDTPYRFIATVHSSGLTTLYVNGVSVDNFTNAANWAASGSGQFALGINASTSPDNWSGEVSEALISTAYNDATNVGLLDTYLKNKWGLTGPSYANPGGAGNRTSTITVTSSAMGGAGSISILVDGAYANGLFWSNGVTGGLITFDFGVGAAKRIDEFKWTQQYAASHGTWVFEGSNDNSSYTTFPGSFDLGNAAPPQTIAVTNTNTYRYYRLRQTAGGTNTGPYLHEIEFRII